MDIVESSAILGSDVYHYDTPEGYELFHQLKEQKALSLFSSKYGSLLPLLHAYRETKIISEQENILRTLRDHGVSFSILKDVFRVGSSRISRLIDSRPRKCDILAPQIINDINDFLNRVNLHVEFACEHLKYVMFSPHICRLDSA